MLFNHFLQHYFMICFYKMLFNLIDTLTPRSVATPRSAAFFAVPR